MVTFQSPLPLGLFPLQPCRRAASPLCTHVSPSHCEEDEDDKDGDNDLGDGDDDLDNGADGGLLLLHHPDSRLLPARRIKNLKIIFRDSNIVIKYHCFRFLYCHLESFAAYHMII